MWFAAFLPALLATILFFMDQHITAVIINRKENKLKVNETNFISVEAKINKEFSFFNRKEAVIIWTY